MRIEGWEDRLAAVVESARHVPYKLGQHDCFRLACRVVNALTGIDQWPLWEGKYSTVSDAMRLLAERGSSFEDAFDWFFNSARVSYRLARRGDVLCLQTPDGQKHLGICLGSRAAFLSPTGLLFIPTADALCAWRVD